jgi:hypothetical protein
MEENPVIVGAMIAGAAAICGAVVGQLFPFLSSWVDHRRKKQDHLRAKYESVALLFSKSIQWYQTVQAADSLKELQARSFPSEARELYSLCLVYFPDLREPASLYLNSMALVYGSFVDNFVSDNGSNAGTQAVLNGGQEHLSICKAAQEARQNLENGIELFASKYTSL